MLVGYEIGKQRESDIASASNIKKNCSQEWVQKIKLTFSVLYISRTCEKETKMFSMAF